jgi:Beta protein
MTPDPQRYMPCLRWKMGEYQALLQLTPMARDSIKPIIEVAEIGFDFENHTQSKSIDEHLNPFAKRVKKKWGTKECFIDMHLIDASKRMANGQHPITFVFDDLRLQGVYAIPVMGINQDSHWQDAIQKAVDDDGRGFCFRISLEDAMNPSLRTSIGSILNKYGRQVEHCDLIIDEVAPNYEPLDGFIGLLETIINNLPYLNNWRSFGLIGTSLPSTLSILGSGSSIIPRNEWLAYRELIVCLKSLGVRIPTFGDYVINHPEVLKIDPRHMKSTANIRYTIKDSWLIVRGQTIEKGGLEQHKDLCEMIVRSKDFKGKGFSQGDKYIFDCSKGNASTGNLTTWRWVGTNHHLETVVQDIANLFAS